MTSSIIAFDDSKFRNKLNALMAVTRDKKKLLTEIGLQVESSIAKNFKKEEDSKGAKWKSTIRGGRILQDKGNLRHIVSEVQGSSVKVGTTVEYGIYHQYGTGVYGPKGTPIVPVNAKSLHFTIGKNNVFTKSVQGSPIREWLYISQEGKDKLHKLLEKRFLQALKDA